MALFYFRLESNGFTVRDEQGDEFCALDEAIEHAKTVAAELAHKSNRGDQQLSVLDEGGTVVFEIAISGPDTHPTHNARPPPLRRP